MITKHDLLAIVGSPELESLEVLQQELAPQIRYRTFVRWSNIPVKGQKLAAIQLGATYFSTRAAVIEFINAINA